MIFAEIPFPQTLAEFWTQLISDGASTNQYIQFIKYAFVGGLATLVHIAMFYSIGLFCFPLLTSDDKVVKILKLKVVDIDQRRRARNASISNVISFIFANVFCFIINRMFVFTPGRFDPFIEFILFVAAAALALVVGTAIMRFLIKKHNIDTTVAFSANIVVSFLLNYVLRKFFIFAG